MLNQSRISQYASAIKGCAAQYSIVQVMLEQARLAAMEDKWKAKEAEMQTVDEKQDWLAMIAEGRQIHQDTIKDAQAGSPAYIERVKEVVDTNADGKVGARTASHSLTVFLPLDNCITALLLSQCVHALDQLQCAPSHIHLPSASVSLPYCLPH